jgi:SAM-dependent methyltransferase
VNKLYGFFIIGCLLILAFVPQFIEARSKKMLAAVAAAACCGGNCCPQPESASTTKNPVKKLADAQSSQENDVKAIIKEAYGNVAKEGTGCTGGCCGGGCDLSSTIGYTAEELAMFADANLGLGCGHPMSLGSVKEGDVVLDLGSGAGLDCFLAARKVGASGKVIGVDMTSAMIEKARENAKKYGFTNVEFRLGDIEALPVESNSIDVIMSNCVINLAPQKHLVFKEAGRVLKSGGVMAVSDVVLLKDLTETQKKDSGLLCACVSGALLKETYIGMLEKAGFEVTIIDEDTEINKKWFNSNALPISSIKFIARKK